MAFKNLIGGIRWKLDFIKHDFTCSGRHFLNEPILKRMSTRTLTKTTYIHKIEESDLIRVTIFLEADPKMKSKVIINKPLEAPLLTLLEKVNFVVRKALKFCKEEVNALLLLNGDPVDVNINCSNIFNLNGDLRLRLFQDYYACTLNEPFVILINMPQNPVSRTYIYPLKLETLFADECDMKWFRSSATNRNELMNEKNWIQVGKGYYYLIQDDDVSHYLKLECVPVRGHVKGPCSKTILKNRVESNFCSYYYYKTHELTKEEVKGDMFRLVTYNVLASYYTNTKEGKKMFDYCPKYAMEKNCRFSAIAHELCGYNSDIICLQEVDKEIYIKFWLPFFKDLGFCGSMCAKLSAPEGTVCFYRESKFTLLCSEKFNFGIEIQENPHLKDIWLYLQDKINLLQKYISLQHCLQLMALQSNIKTNEVLIIGNVHLYSHPEANVIRILQAAATFRLFNFMLEQLQTLLLNKNVSFIFCGDFNSIPTSPIHDYIKNLISNKNLEENVNMEDFTEFAHPLQMKCAYEMPLLTNYTQDFKGCLDYIYYQSDRLEIDKIYPVADEKELSANIGIPSVSFPSDHVPLIVDFKWKY